jgi:WD40 repeat protein
MSARLTRARERLRACLARRGYAIPSAGVATALGTALAEAAVPLPLYAHTVSAAVWFAGAESGTAALASAQAIALARGAFRAMFLGQVKVAAAVLLAVALLGIGTTMLLKAASPVGQPPPAPPQLAPAATPDRDEAPRERLPQGGLARMGTPRLRHGDAVSFAAYTPDGKALLTAGRDNIVRMWDLATGMEIRRFDAGDLQPGGKAPAAEDGINERYYQQRWETLARSFQAALSSDGKMVATSRGGVVCLWETATGKKRRQIQTGQRQLLQLQFSADGKSLFTLGRGQASAVWEVATGRCQQRREGKPAPHWMGPPSAITDQTMAVSPGLKYLAAWTLDDDALPMIVIRDVASNKEVSRIKASSAVMALAFSADEKSVAWHNGEDTSIIVSDVQSGKVLRRLRSAGQSDSATSGDPAMAIAFSANGKALAVSWMSRTIELWDLTSGKQTLPVGKPTSAQHEQQSTNWWTIMVRPALAFSPDSKRLVCSLGSATIRQLRVDTGAEIPMPGTGHRAVVSTLALSADGKSLLTYGPGDPVRSWDWLTGKETGKRDVPAGATHAVLAKDGGFGFAAEHAFTFTSAGKTKTWKVATENSQVVSVALSPDGTVLATRHFLRTEVHLWDVATGKKRLTLGRAVEDTGLGNMTETTGVLPLDVVFSPDGRCLATAGTRRHLCLWDVATGALLWEVFPQPGQAVERFAFSPDGRSLACINVDRTVTLYEVSSRAQRGQLGEADPKHRRVYLTDCSTGPLFDFQRERDAPVCLAFSPDGRYLATAQDSPEIHLWDLLAGREVGTLPGPECGVVGLLFTPDGKHLVSAGTDTTALTWDLTRLIRREAAVAALLQPQALDALWNDLASSDAVRAFAAVRRLSAAPEPAIRLLRDRLRPVVEASPDRLQPLLVALNSPQFRQRQTAMTQLAALGEQAGPALRVALKANPSLEQRRRIEQLLGAMGATASGEGLRSLRAVEALEWIGSSDARQVLEALTVGMPGARLTQEAKGALGRLGNRAVAP